MKAAARFFDGLFSTHRRAEGGRGRLRVATLELYSWQRRLRLGALGKHQYLAGTCIIKCNTGQWTTDCGQRTAVRLREGCGQSLAPKIKLKQLISTKQPISSKVYLKCLNTQTGEPLGWKERERRYLGLGSQPSLVVGCGKTKGYLILLFWMFDTFRQAACFACNVTSCWNNLAATGPHRNPLPQHSKAQHCVFSSSRATYLPRERERESSEVDDLKTGPTSVNKMF